MIKLIIIAVTLTYLTLPEAWALSSDDFNPLTKEANPVWRYYDPYGTNAGKSKLTFDGTNALISLPAGFNHDLQLPPNNKAPRLLQPAANTNFQIEVKFETPLTADAQQQGVIVQQSDQVFLRFDIHYGPDRPKLYVAYINGDANTRTVYKSALLPLTARDQHRNFPRYRQVIRSDDQWTFRYSYDRTTWVNAVTFTKSLTVTEVGVFAGASVTNPAFLSSIDYFMDLSKPVNDTDTWLAPPPVISTWYGYDQVSGSFGLPGVSQQWANVLGTVFSNLDLTALSYRLNGGPVQTLSFGPDTKLGTRENGRLVKTGDFNIEIPPTSLQAGANSVAITATDSNGTKSTKTITLAYAPGNEWPLPYTANWQSVNTQRVESIAHVVDGLWKITPAGLRVVQKGYDRAVAIGDRNWPPHYEVTVPFTLHSSFNGIGFAVGWQGHTGVQSPKIEWPLEALAWVRGPVSNPTLEIITYGGLVGWEVVQAVQPISIALNKTYMLKGRTELLNATTSRFRVKLWPQGSAEPVSWNLSADVPRRDGSVLLVALGTEATFGNVAIEPLAGLPPPANDVTPPVISNIKTSSVTSNSATIGWTTDEAANSAVDYGPTSSYGANASDAAQVISHSLTLTGLSPNTTYHYRVKSTDASGNTAGSTDRTFTTSASSGNASGLVSDAFTGALNTSLWSFYDPVGNSTVSTTGSQASISVPAGVAHDLWTNALNAPRIRQPANNTDFEIEAKFDSLVASKFQMQGFTVEQDDTRLLRLDVYSDGSKTRIFSASFVNGTATKRFATVIANGAPKYLRIKRAGNNWTLSYSENGSGWTVAGAYAFTLNVTKVGLFAGNGGSPIPAHTALVDYFTVR